MTDFRDGLVRCLACALAAGSFVALGDAAVLFRTAQGAFLSGAEIETTLLAAVATGVALALVAAGLSALSLIASRWRAEPSQARRRAAFAAFAVAAAASDLALWLLTGGRRAHLLPARPVLVLAGAVVLGALVAAATAGIVRVRDSGSGRGRASLAAATATVSLGATIVSATVLPRGYPVFHVGLAVLAVLAAVVAADLALPRALTTSAVARVASIVVAVVAVVVVAGSPFALLALRRTPNARYVAEERAPIVGRVVRLVRLATPVALPPARLAAAPRRGSVPVAAAASLVLRSQDVLLVTIDALRYDRIAALGGHGLTPAIDALAREGVVFRHAYTATPHTSYALASILTGKLIRPVMELPDPPTDHVTLPELLRRYGIRTAAFYPPAIFFVDEARFTRFQANGFGFEYRKEMYAPAAARVGQLDDYLDASDPSRPVFAWVHLFEPHEPYDPPPGLATSDTAEGRYDGEVRAADAAFGDLVRVFRAARPGGTVIVTADHGEEFGDHGGEYHGTTLYDEQARVPLVWSTPGLVAPHVVDAPVSTIDLAPTLLAALGIPKDARMRGEDLGPVLHDAHAPAPAYAYASLGETWMITDGRHKEICVESEVECRLFDLDRDPHELHDLAGSDPDGAAELRRALSAMIGSIPRVEAVAMSNGVGWPDALARAELGDGAAGPDVVPLLASDRADVRAAAARSLAKLAYAPAAATLARVRSGDVDPSARAEAAIAGLILGDESARSDVEALVRDLPDGGASVDRERQRRAALALARAGDPVAVPVLVAIAVDHGEAETSRVAALAALGALHAHDAVGPIVSLLPDVRLRIAAAEALGVIADRRAAPALLAALAVERYVPARGEEARALANVAERRAAPLIRRFLGVEHPVPDGVEALARLGDLTHESAAGAVLSRAQSLRRGGWACDAVGCAPGDGAVLAVPRNGRPASPSRFVLRVVVGTSGGTLRFDRGGVPTPVQPGASEISFVIDDATSLDAATVGATNVRLVAFAWVPSTDELPPPPPQPWRDGGTD